MRGRGPHERGGPKDWRLQASAGMWVPPQRLQMPRWKVIVLSLASLAFLILIRWYVIPRLWAVPR